MLCAIALEIEIVLVLLAIIATSFLVSTIIDLLSHYIFKDMKITFSITGQQQVPQFF